jgi:hypothetical protein
MHLTMAPVIPSKGDPNQDRVHQRRHERHKDRRDTNTQRGPPRSESSRAYKESTPYNHNDTRFKDREPQRDDRRNDKWDGRRDSRQDDGGYRHGNSHYRDRGLEPEYGTTHRGNGGSYGILDRDFDERRSGDRYRDERRAGDEISSSRAKGPSVSMEGLTQAEITPTCFPTLRPVVHIYETVILPAECGEDHITPINEDVRTSIVLLLCQTVFQLRSL